MGLFKKIADYQGTTHGVDPTGHDHSQSEGWLSTIVSNLTALIQGKADAVHTHTKSQITDFAHTHFGDDIFVGSDDTSLTLEEFAENHNHSISNVTGLQAALDGKFNKSDIKTAASFPTSDTKVLSEKAVVNYIDNAIQPGGVINLGDLQQSNPLNIDVESPDPTEGFHYGRLLFFTNNLGGVASALSELLVSSDEGREIHFHLNAADLQKRCNMIRVFKFAPHPDDPTRFDYFVEVAGAWDFE